MTSLLSNLTLIDTHFQVNRTGVSIEFHFVLVSLSMVYLPVQADFATRPNPGSKRPVSLSQDPPRMRAAVIRNQKGTLNFLLVITGRGPGNASVLRCSGALGRPSLGPRRSQMRHHPPRLILKIFAI